LFYFQGIIIMQHLPECQVLKRVFFLMLVLPVLVFLAGCQTTAPYSSPWSFPYPTTDRDAPREAADVAPPEMDWRTAETRRGLEVYYHRAGPDAEGEMHHHRGGVSQEVLKPPSGTPEFSAIRRDRTAPPTAQPGEVTVALLLPLSGQHSRLGQSMMQAAQMALFDLDSQAVRLLPKDTKGTPDGAQQAALQALDEGAQLILGPVFSESVKAVSAVAAPSRTPVIAYTTDWTAAGSNTYVMGFLPFSQVIRIVNYAVHRGYRDIGFFGPHGDYGTIVMRTLHYSLQQHRMNVGKIGNFSPTEPELHHVVQEFLEAPAPRRGAAENFPIDSVVVPVGGQALQTVANMFSYYNAGQRRVRFLGTGLWDDPSLAGEQTLHGAWFAASDPALRKDFEDRYRENFRRAPERLASLAYDSMALAVVLAKTHDGYGHPYARNRLVTQSGFAGIDGIFRFRRDNLVERGLAVLEITRDGPRVIDPAPEAFHFASN